MKLLHSLFFAFLLLLVAPGFASEGHLLLIDKNVQLKLPVEALREQAETELTLFSPFSKRDIDIKGILLETLLEQSLSRIPERIKLVALDGYEIIFEQWQKNHWIIVTHEDGLPLSLRQRGPLRIVGRDHGDKDPKNLRDFNDWIWMLARIEILP